MNSAFQLLVMLAITALSGALACSSASSERDVQSQTPAGLSVAQALSADDTQGYERAEKARAFQFPLDHGPHPSFRNEWWYVTGNLFGSTKEQRFGFQLTLFRNRLSSKQLGQTPQTDAIPRSAWRSHTVWMGHFAVSDIASGHHAVYERFSRQALQLAGAEGEPTQRVWLEDWQLLREQGEGELWRLEAAQQQTRLSLRLTARKPLVLQGDAGLSQKSSEAGNASYYYSMTRLAAEGTVELAGKTTAVKGTAWLDREWSTSALGPDQEGWDWFALQFDDGRELMYYQLRRKDGTPSPHSAGVVVECEGGRVRVTRDQVDLSVLERWRSPKTAASYPAVWRLRIASLGLDLQIRSVLADQEMRVSFPYWEGAVDVTNHADSKQVGVGYVELTGY